jgi:hypothetical protein
MLLHILDYMKHVDILQYCEHTKFADSVMPLRPAASISKSGSSSICSGSAFSEGNYRRSESEGGTID